jgi:hypothetical protein
MRPVEYIAVIASIGGAFVLGRMLARSHRQAPSAPQVDPNAPPPSLTTPAPAATAPAPAPQRVPGETARVFAPPALAIAPTSPWERITRDAPDAASRIYQAVIGVMEPRRRALVWKRCAPPESIGRSALVFRVDVELQENRLRVGDARFVAVEDGVDLGAAVGDCIARQLSSSSELPLTAGTPVFTGEVDYRFAVDFGT